MNVWAAGLKRSSLFGSVVLAAALLISSAVRPGGRAHADTIITVNDQCSLVDAINAANSHGAIVIPVEIAAKVPDACELCARRETPILEIARAKDFSLEKLKEALKRSAEIH